jgi:hypothetical protein
MRWEARGRLLGDDITVAWEDGAYSTDSLTTDLVFEGVLVEATELYRLDELPVGYQGMSRVADPVSDPRWSIELALFVMQDGRVTFRSDDMPDDSPPEGAIA